MPEPPDLPNSPEFEKVSDLFEPLEKMKKLKSFWRTRALVLNDEPLQTETTQKLRERGLLGPWTFNALQSSLSAFPGIALAFGVRLILHQQSAPEDSFERTTKYFEPLIVPFSLLIAAFFVARVYAHVREATRAERETVQRYYLYLDGAYGFFPQMLCSLQLAALQLELQGLIPPNSANFTQLIWAWQIVITFRILPQNIFLNRESLDHPITIFDDKPRDVPWLRYSLTMLVGIPACCLGLLLAVFLLSVPIAPLLHVLNLA